ncbi:odorant receptor 4-like isoform X4 [Vespula maculifrons]|uniref:Odorant receptor 4-like isoform X4 n=1 Tax=Vespula maculifrons TaxID=7453 RepID=A0ABD2CVW0_VESMC
MIDLNKLIIIFGYVETDYLFISLISHISGFFSNMSIQQKAKLISFDITRDCVLNTPLPYCYIGRCLINELTFSFLNVTKCKEMRFTMLTPRSYGKSLNHFNKFWIDNCLAQISNRSCQ